MEKENDEKDEKAPKRINLDGNKIGKRCQKRNHLLFMLIFVVSRRNEFIVVLTLTPALLRNAIEMDFLL